MKTILSTILFLTICVVNSNSQNQFNDVNIVGKMSDVMWNGELFGKINIDTITNKNNLYGFGPAENLRGEILILDGVSYKSNVINNQEMKVIETFKIKAPFFAYSNISNWEEKIIPDSITTIEQFEKFINEITENRPRPFLFKLSGEIEFADIHIVNLPRNKKVSSPDDAHIGQKNYILNNVNSEIIGFFSTKHKSIFTHHDTFLHMHLISNDRKKMGHVDKLSFNNKKLKLYLPLN